MKDNFIKSYSFDFSTEIAMYCRILEDKRYYNVANQLFRSGTSIGANVWEADHAESRKDFVHKMKICLKELRETAVCLKIIQRKEYFKGERLDPLLKENNELISIFVKSIKTAKEKDVSKSQ